MGALKDSVEGGLDQMSVAGWALRVNSGGGVPAPGTGSLELMVLNSDMVLVAFVYIVACS